MTTLVATSLVTEHNFDLNEFPQVAAVRDRYDLVSVDGHVQTYFPWPPMLFAVPAAAIARAVGIGSSYWVVEGGINTWPVEVPVAASLIVWTVFLLWRLTRRLLAQLGDSAPAAAFVVTAIAAVGTILSSTGRAALWNQTACLPFVVLGLTECVRIHNGEHERAFWFGVWGALAFTMRPTALALLVPLGVWVVCRARRLFRAAMGAAAVAVPFALVSIWVYRTPLPPYYAASHLGTTSTFVEAAVGGLVSPSRGLLIFTPIVTGSLVGAVIGLRRSWCNPMVLAVLLGVLLQWLVISDFAQWWAGATFGPRFFLEAIPLYAVLALPLVEHLWVVGMRRVWAAVLAVLTFVSVTINVEGSYVRAAYCWSATPVPVDVKPSRVWDIGDAQPLRGFRELLSTSPAQAIAGSCDAGSG